MLHARTQQEKVGRAPTFPARWCLLPTAELRKSGPGPIMTNGLSLLSMRQVRCPLPVIPSPDPRVLPAERTRSIGIGDDDSVLLCVTGFLDRGQLTEVLKLRPVQAEKLRSSGGIPDAHGRPAPRNLLTTGETGRPRSGCQEAPGDLVSSLKKSTGGSSTGMHQVVSDAILRGGFGHTDEQQTTAQKGYETLPIV